MSEIVREGVVVVTDGKGEWYAPPISDIPDGAYEVRSVWKPIQANPPKGATMPESVSISDKLEIIYFGNHPQRRLILCQVPPDGVDGIAVCEVMDHDERDQTAQRLVDLWNGTTQTRLATATELVREAIDYGDFSDKPDVRTSLAAFLEGCR